MLPTHNLFSQPISIINLFYYLSQSTTLGLINLLNSSLQPTRYAVCFCVYYLSQCTEQIQRVATVSTCGSNLSLKMDYSSSENQLESNRMILTLDSYGCSSCRGVDGESGANTTGKLRLCRPDCSMNATPFAAKPAAS